MMDFREDGAAALEWAAQYLERVDELPVLAQVKPGELTARLPESAPEQPEPFSAVLRDMDDFAAVNEVYVEYFKNEPRPARALVPVPGSRGPVSFDAIAYVPD